MHYQSKNSRAIIVKIFNYIKYLFLDHDAIDLIELTELEDLLYYDLSKYRLNLNINLSELLLSDDYSGIPLDRIECMEINP